MGISAEEMSEDEEEEDEDDDDDEKYEEEDRKEYIRLNSLAGESGEGSTNGSAEAVVFFMRSVSPSASCSPASAAVMISSPVLFAVSEFEIKKGTSAAEAAARAVGAAVRASEFALGMPELTENVNAGVIVLRWSG